MTFYSIRKFSLIDYPGQISVLLFTYGCDFRCPFCHNPELVIKAGSTNIDASNSVKVSDVHAEEKAGEDSDKQTDSAENDINRFKNGDVRSEMENLYISEDEVLSFLKTRVGKLDGLAVTGGEPLLHGDLLSFLKKVQDLGFLVKVDTNGSFPERLETFIDSGVVNYWAMDIKNSKERYTETVGVDVDMKKIQKSIQLISEAGRKGIDYEFRTTVVPSLHDTESIEGVGELIKGAKKFVLQNFRGGRTLDKSFSTKPSFSNDELDKFRKIMSGFVERVEIRN